MHSILLSRRRGLLGLAAGATLAPFLSARAATPSQGPVLLTAGGLVGAPNRGPSDPKRDRLFDHNNLSFQKARTFSVDELRAMPQEIVSANLYGIDVQAKGPRLKDIADAAKPTVAVKSLRLFAIDGYGAEIPLADIQSQSWILAMETDGSAFAIGDFGPLFAMRQLGPDEKKTDEEGAKWVYSLYYIELAA